MIERPDVLTLANALREVDSLRGLCLEAADELTRLRAEVEALRADSLRYKWLANRVLACDYGDNNAPGEQIGWRIRGDLKADSEPFMLGASIDTAIDAARAALKEAS